MGSYVCLQVSLERQNLSCSPNSTVRWERWGSHLAGLTISQVFSLLLLGLNCFSSPAALPQNCLRPHWISLGFLSETRPLAGKGDFHLGWKFWHLHWGMCRERGGEILELRHRVKWEILFQKTTPWLHFADSFPGKEKAKKWIYLGNKTWS